MLQEAEELTDDEITYLNENCWLVHRNPSRDLAVTTRQNFCESYIKRIAGSNMKSEAHKYLPMSDMVCEVCFGKCLTQEGIVLIQWCLGFNRGLWVVLSHRALQ